MAALQGTYELFDTYVKTMLEHTPPGKAPSLDKFKKHMESINSLVSTIGQHFDDISKSQTTVLEILDDDFCAFTPAPSPVGSSPSMVPSSIESAAASTTPSETLARFHGLIVQCYRDLGQLKNVWTALIDINSTDGFENIRRWIMSTFENWIINHQITYTWKTLIRLMDILIDFYQRIKPSLHSLHQALLDFHESFLTVYSAKDLPFSLLIKSFTTSSLVDLISKINPSNSPSSYNNGWFNTVETGKPSTTLQRTKRVTLNPNPRRLPRDRQFIDPGALAMIDYIDLPKPADLTITTSMDDDSHPDGVPSFFDFSVTSSKSASATPHDVGFSFLDTQDIFISDPFPRLEYGEATTKPHVHGSMEFVSKEGDKYTYKILTDGLYSDKRTPAVWLASLTFQEEKGIDIAVYPVNPEPHIATYLYIIIETPEDLQVEGAMEVRVRWIMYGNPSDPRNMIHIGETIHIKHYYYAFDIKSPELPGIDPKRAPRVLMGLNRLQGPSHKEGCKVMMSYSWMSPNQFCYFINAGKGNKWEATAVWIVAPQLAK